MDKIDLIRDPSSAPDTMWFFSNRALEVCFNALSSGSLTEDRYRDLVRRLIDKGLISQIGCISNIGLPPASKPLPDYLL